MLDALPRPRCRSCARCRLEYAATTGRCMELLQAMEHLERQAQQQRGKEQPEAESDPGNPLRASVFLSLGLAVVLSLAPST